MAQATPQFRFITMTKIVAALPLVLVLVLCACSKDGSMGEATGPAPTPEASPSSATEVADARVVVPQTRFIHAEPAELTNCEFTKVTLKWDASGAGIPIAVVEIHAGDATSTPGLFAAGGITGEKETGPWVRPGSTFSLRDKATGNELEKLVIGGPRCT